MEKCDNSSWIYRGGSKKLDEEQLVWLTNVRGLASNFDALNLRLRTSSVSPKIIALYETFVNANIHDFAAYAIGGYESYRVDRAGHGGGSAVYTHHSPICVTFFDLFAKL